MHLTKCLSTFSYLTPTIKSSNKKMRLHSNSKDCQLWTAIFFFLDLVNMRNERCELLHLLGDGICDDPVNNKQCNFDNGDCCLPETIKINCLICYCQKFLDYTITNSITTTTSPINGPTNSTITMSISGP